MSSVGTTALANLFDFWLIGAFYYHAMLQYIFLHFGQTRNLISFCTLQFVFFPYLFMFCLCGSLYDHKGSIQTKKKKIMQLYLSMFYLLVYLHTCLFCLVCFICLPTRETDGTRISFESINVLKQKGISFIKIKPANVTLHCISWPNL